MDDKLHKCFSENCKECSKCKKYKCEFKELIYCKGSWCGNEKYEYACKKCDGRDGLVGIFKCRGCDAILSIK